MFERVFGAFKKPIVYATVVLSGLMGSTSAYSDSRLNPCKNPDLSRYMQTRNDCLDIVYSSTSGSDEAKVAGVERFVDAIGRKGSINETVARGSDIVFLIKTPEGPYSLTLKRDAGSSLERQIEFLNSLCDRRHQQARRQSTSYSGSDNSGLQRAYQEEMDLDGVDATLEGGSEFAGMLVGGLIGGAVKGKFGHGRRGHHRGGGRHGGGDGGQTGQGFHNVNTGMNPPAVNPVNGGSIRGP